MIIKHPNITDLPRLSALWEEAFCDGGFGPFYDKAFEPKRCLAAFDGDSLLAALYWFDCELNENPIAYVYGVATFKEHRGKGICRRLLNATAEFLQERGYQGIVLVPAKPTLYAFYEKMGFAVCSFVKEFTALKSKEKEIVEEIGVDEYAALRKTLLPENSVVQKGANLEYLSSYARFYKGENFLLVASVEKGKFHGIELLGDERKAGGILCALGFETGAFRTVGDGRRFAMYRPLGKGKEPAYFGLAFD